MRPKLLLLITVGSIAGCDNQGAIPIPAEAVLTASQYVKSSHEAICDQVKRCCSAPLDPTLCGPDAVDSDPLAIAIDKDVAAGNTTFDTDGAAKCLQSIRAASCDDPDRFLVSGNACELSILVREHESPLRGGKAGEDCRFSEDCEPNLSCRGDGTCGSVMPAGTPCRLDNPGVCESDGCESSDPNATFGICSPFSTVRQGLCLR